MNDITRPPVRPPLPDAATRHANTIDEIRAMHADYRRMQEQGVADQRTIDQQANMISLLTADKQSLAQAGQVLQRKLIRLAAAMSGIGKLAQDAEEIMKSSLDWQETEEEAAREQAGAAKVVASLPAGQ